MVETHIEPSQKLQEEYKLNKRKKTKFKHTQDIPDWYDPMAF